MLSLEQFEDIKAQAFAGIPTELEGVCKIYPLTMREILEIGYSKYNAYLGLLLLDNEGIIKIIEKKTGQKLSSEKIAPLNYLLNSADQSDSFLLDLQFVFSTFIKEEVLFLPSLGAVVVGSPEEKRLITNSNFEQFQDILKVQNRIKIEIEDKKYENETPGQRKMRLLKEKVAATKKKQAEKEKEGETQEDFSLATLLEIASTFGIQWKDETLYAFFSLVKRHQAKEKWERDTQFMCAGADPNNMNTVYWGENLDKE